MILKCGVILSGKYTEWNIEVVDDTSGSTGGFYIFIINKLKDESYDYWFEKYEYLENQLTDFDVKWN